MTTHVELEQQRFSPPPAPELVSALAVAGAAAAVETSVEVHGAENRAAVAGAGDDDVVVEGQNGNKTAVELEC